MNSLRWALTAASAAKRTPAIRANENIGYESSQPQNALTSTGLLREAQYTHPARVTRRGEDRYRENAAGIRFLIVAGSSNLPQPRLLP
jgi:hypothetical protein